MGAMPSPASAGVGMRSFGTLNMLTRLLRKRESMAPILLLPVFG